MQPMQELLRNSYYGKESASGNSWNRLKRRGRKCEQRELLLTNSVITITHGQFIILTAKSSILCIIAKTVTKKEGNTTRQIVAELLINNLPLQRFLHRKKWNTNTHKSSAETSTHVIGGIITED